MSEHRARIIWSRQGTEFTPKEYPRDHLWQFDGGSEVRASAAPEYLGNDALVDPEQAFVAAISSCHMLTFLALAAHEGFVIDSYEDDPIGYLERNEDRKLAITRVVLSPRIVYDGDKPSPEQRKKLHDQAHLQCFIATSVNTKIEIYSAN